MRTKWKELLWAFILVTVVAYLYIEVGSETALITATLKGYPAMARPNFWPRLMLVGLLATGLLKLYVTGRKRAEHQREKGSAPRIFIPKVIVSIFTVGLYCYLSQYIGFAFATMVFTGGYMWFLGMREVKMLISFPILSTLVVLLVFWRLLYIAVPKGVGIFLAFSNLLMSIVRVGA
jgi:putative tricarboxylic transport membrane protein